ncbi:MAG: hypothetical protein ACRDTX_12170 [Pseudonocardiaceae bacterium]
MLRSACTAPRRAGRSAALRVHLAGNHTTLAAGHDLSAETGLSLSELMRRAVDRCYGRGRDLDQDLRRLRAGHGAWADHDETGEEYVERIRSGRRLAGS